MQIVSIYIMPYDRNMQMNHIIYERLHLPHSVPITYRVLPPPPPPHSSYPDWHEQTPDPHQTSAPTNRSLAEYCDWVGKLIWQTNEEKGGREWAETRVLEKCSGGTRIPPQRLLAGANSPKQLRN